jgi:hypothetical protein
MGGDAFWFQHDSNARDDPKCSLLIDQLGLEGYGIYWVLLETLRDQPGYRYPLALLPMLARKYLTTAEKMKVVVGNYGLFCVDEGEFFLSPALCRRMMKWDEKRELNRLKGIKSGERRRLQAAMRPGPELQLNSGSTSVEQEQNRTRQDNIYNKQHTTERSLGPGIAMDNVLLIIAKIIGNESAQRWLTERGPDYCQAQVTAMDRQGNNIRNARQWLLSALQNNWAKWQMPAPQPDPSCPLCSGQGTIADFANNTTRLCKCIEQPHPATAVKPTISDQAPAALAAAVAQALKV